MPVLGLPRKRGFALLGGIAVTVILVLWLVPPFFVDDVDDDARQTELENDARRTAAQALGLILLGVGAFFTGRTVQVTREGQTTERFTKAIDHLGSTNYAVRTGGVYALERIALTSALERRAVEDVLAAVVRQEAPRRRRAEPDPDAPEDAFQLGHHDDKSDAFEPPWDRLPADRVDVAGTLTVLGRLHPPRSAKPYLDLSYADLRRAVLANARLPYTAFRLTDLRQAFLTDAHLTNCVFSMTDLRDVEAAGAQFNGATFFKCKFQGAGLSKASFRNARFELCDLRDTDLSDVQLRGACYDASTLWPEAFDPAPLGATTPCRKPAGSARPGDSGSADSATADGPYR